MIYIAVALKAEAQAFVDRYKLTKSRLGDFVLFYGENFKLIVTGIGVANMERAVNLLIEKFAPNESDIFLNIGICGANQKYKIGQLIEIGTVIYENKKFIINKNISNLLTCKDREASEDMYEIVDMESFGFCKSTKEIKNRRIYKVVSDHFEPSLVTKEGTKMAIFYVIDEIMQRIKS